MAAHDVLRTQLSIFAGQFDLLPTMSALAGYATVAVGQNVLVRGFSRWRRQGGRQARWQVVLG